MAKKYVPGPNVVAYKSANELKAGETFQKLPAGMYSFKIVSDPETSIFSTNYYIEIVKEEMSSDEIIDLPSKAFTRATEELKSFLSSETKQTYKHLGFLYKRSWLFYGMPGTGKSVLVKKFAQNIVDQGGIVFTNLAGIINKDLNKYFHPFNHTQLMCIIIEEFEGIRDGSDELTALDGGNMRDNVIFLCTTNYIEKIPPRMLRPGRIHSKIEVGPLEYESRLAYFNSKITDNVEAVRLAEVSDGLVIDELKELIQQTLLLKRDAAEVRNELIEFRKNATEKYYDPDSDPNIRKNITYIRNS